MVSEKAIARPNVSGVIFFDIPKEKFFIFINQDKPLERQHFTTAHEVGHYFLHQDIIKSKTIIIDGDDSLDGSAMLFRSDVDVATNIEREANNFAATLIMPEKFVKKAWEALKSVEECAKVFNVSVSAMAIRLEKLRILKV
ncbi:MAG: ImmA/IrrE family metallo-endopeptidase [Candidatus Gribaldobacteria bacterium]|nr:ImmA/IrrE family metallo-endopeptidase [Candidatus Gribaldobacteria bacterium]